MTHMQDRLRTLSPDALRGMRRGIEKESLRVTPDGQLALTPHPAALGSALTHPRITTDFSESQPELVTGAHVSTAACIDELVELHRIVLGAIGDERLWVSSMPCMLPDGDGIPIGRYGSSHIGRAKSVYRTGLAHRYGRRMQTISGIHYNWSLPGVDDDGYFALIRNVRRQAPLLLYLFGASPALCATFVAGSQHALQPLGAGTLHLPHATSLRMGRLGYQSDAQSTLAIGYDDLADYGRTLEEALTLPYPPYEAIGIRDADGGYRQLATGLLQIENELYGVVRPKCVIRPGERPLHALRERGVQYVELRCMDLDPFETVGIAPATMRFLDVFMLHALLAPSPRDTPQHNVLIARNQERTASAGREPGLILEQPDGSRPTLLEWARRLLDGFAPVARALDAAHDTDAHAEALAAAFALLDDPSRTPSARVLDVLRREHDGAYGPFVRARSDAARDALLAQPLAPEAVARAEDEARRSVEGRNAQEAADASVPFETYRQAYLSPERLRVDPADAGRRAPGG